MTVWIEDTAAWSEQVPIYGYEERSVCNVCGADVTGNVSTHAKAHMLAGEGSGHHNEYIQVVTCYETVAHPRRGPLGDRGVRRALGIATTNKQPAEAGRFTD